MLSAMNDNTRRLGVLDDPGDFDPDWAAEPGRSWEGWGILDDTAMMLPFELIGTTI